MNPLIFLLFMGYKRAPGAAPPAIVIPPPLPPKVPEVAPYLPPPIPVQPKIIAVVPPTEKHVYPTYVVPGIAVPLPSGVLRQIYKVRF